MKFLLVGGGAREHAIAKNAAQYYDVYAAMPYKNPGIARLANYKVVDILNPQKVADYCDEVSPDLVFIGSEESLFHGVSDEIIKREHVCIGAKKKAAEIERSKAFMRRLLEKNNIHGSLRFKTFTDTDTALRYIDEYAGSIAIKPARQAGGKGVKVIADLQAYLQEEKKDAKKKHAEQIMKEHLSQDLEDQILIEERVEGVEYSLQCFTDGSTVIPLPLVQDHPHAFEEDIGPETGGMGAVSGKGVLPFIEDSEYRKSLEIMEQSVQSIKTETGETYHGVITGQFMLTDKWGPTIIEYYARLGDPEAVNVMNILENFDEICEGYLNGSLATVNPRIREVATVVKCISPKGYPNERSMGKGKNLVIDFEKIHSLGAEVFFGSVYEDNEELHTGGSRAVEIYAEGDTIVRAGAIAEKATHYVSSDWKLFHRHDIGSSELLDKRMRTAQLVRDVYQYRGQHGLIGRNIDWIPGIGKIET
jgi:phosphoribosylamine--glycine ligase